MFLLPPSFEMRGNKEKSPTRTLAGLPNALLAVVSTALSYGIVHHQVMQMSLYE
jgi:hypothetical protein